MPEVTSGSVLGNIVADGSGERAYLNWQLASQSIPGNYTDINWQMGWDFSSLSCRGLRRGKAIINSSYVYYNMDAGDAVHAFNSGHNHTPVLEIASGVARLNHGPAGTANFGGFVTLTGFNNQKSEGSNTWDLPTISQTTPAPIMPVLTHIAQKSIRVTFTVPEGGAPIDGKQLGYGTDPDTPTTIVSATGDDAISGLSPATTYYVRARTHNAAGYSAWSTPLIARTIAGAYVNDDGVWKEAIPYVRSGGVWKVARPWINIAGTWKEAI